MWSRANDFVVALVFLLSVFSHQARSDEITLERSGSTIQLAGEILIEAQDSSLLFEAEDGQLWIVEAEEIKAETESDEPTPAVEPKVLGERLLAELPQGFRILERKHYLIAYQTELAYAKWIAGLYESRLYPAFESYWKRKGFPLTKPDHPLVAIIFASKAEYDVYVQRELGTDAGSMVAYYNLMTNRVTMFDLTADQIGANRQLRDDRQINDVLQNPRSIPMVATIIHEATHQLIFNRGMQQRLADTPLWLNEGLALYFEAPDLRAKRGWRAPGKINQPRLDLFKYNYPNRLANAIPTMISDDEPFRQAETGVSAYADAWAFTHFLLNRRPKEFVQYLKDMSLNKPLGTATAEERLGTFEKHFGSDWDRLEADFIKHVRKLR